MTKKKWALLAIVILLLLGYVKLFYKTYTETAVTKSADCIIALDLKKVTNTLIWNTITTPSQWKFSSSSAKEKDKVNWDDMVRLPDYVFIFHASNQPVNAWYTVLEIKDNEDFNKGLQQYHFEKQDGLYASGELGIEFIQSGSKLLLGNLAIEDKNIIKQVADELFNKKQYVSKDILKKNIDAASHLSLQTEKHSMFKDEYLVLANFDKDQIMVSAALPTKFKVNLVVNDFTYCDSSLCTLTFTQPYPDLHSLLPDSTRAAISKAVNFNIDSMLQPTNLFYQLDIEGIHSRIDSAISYTYDDNFNPVEKVVVNAVEELAFDFTVQGKNVNPVYNYWKGNNKLEQTPVGELFTPMPFVRSYCNVKNEKQMAVTSVNYKALPKKHTVQCILFFKLLLTRIPASMMKYLPDGLVKAIKNVASIEVKVNNEKGAIVLRAIINKKKNDLPIVAW